jgi:hypothetical protein
MGWLAHLGAGGSRGRKVVYTILAGIVETTGRTFRYKRNLVRAAVRVDARYRFPGETCSFLAWLPIPVIFPAGF